MRKFVERYLFPASLTYTLTVLCVAAVNMMLGAAQPDNSWLLQVFLFIWLIEGVDFLMDRWEFQSFSVYVTVEFIISYCIFLVVSYFGKWMTFDVRGIARTTVIYLLIFIGIHVYFRCRLKKEAREINDLLQERDER